MRKQVALMEQDLMLESAGTPTEAASGTPTTPASKPTDPSTLQADSTQATTPAAPSGSATPSISGQTNEGPSIGDSVGDDDPDGRSIYVGNVSALLSHPAATTALTRLI